MRPGIGDRHRPRLLSFFALVFAFLVVGFAKPRDPRVTAIVVPDLGGETVETAARKHLTRADGVVLYVALADHAMRIETGPEARSVLSDSEATSILDDRMRPLLREGRSDEAVDAGVVAIEQALARAPNEHRNSGSETVAWVFFAGIGALLTCVIARASVSKPRRGDPDVVHATAHVDTSSSGGLSGGGGASSSW